MDILLSDAYKATNQSGKVINDCLFQKQYLIGKPFPKGEKVITFLNNPSYIDSFLEYDISGVICTEEVAKELQGCYKGGIALSDNPKASFFTIHNYYAQKKRVGRFNWIADSADIHPKATIEDNVSIGENTVIMANAIIKSGTEIGDNCVVRENCVIGSPAFCYFNDGEKSILIESTGNVLIDNNVELHTGVTVEKGEIDGCTIINKNTKIDNFCLIGHDSIIGQNVIIAAGTVLAGGVQLGDGCFLGVGVTIAPWVVCGKNVLLSAGATATKDIPSNTHYSGNFAIQHDKYLEHIRKISK